jgi:branched-chain amino acid transport system substrate-binding protein
MRKILTIITLVIVIIGFSLYFTNKKSDISTQPLKIGVILPLTGPAQAAGEASRKTVELALENLSTSTRQNIQIIFEDDQLDTKLTVAAAQKLIEVDHVKALITYSSASSVAASYIAEKASIPMIGLGNASDINGNKDWVVRYVPSSPLLIDALEKLILKDKYKKIAIIWNQADGPKANAEQTIKVLPNLGYEIVANESVTKSESDFKTSITKLKASNPDVVIVYLSPQVGIFAKQVKDIGWEVPLVGIINFESSGQIKIAEGALDNQLFVGDENANFLTEFYNKYGMYPATAGDNLYDAVTQLANALVKDDSNTAIMKDLRQDFTGVSGEYKYLDDGSYNLKQVVKTWDGNKFIEIK